MTHLGVIWQVLTPLFNAAVYYVIFGVILGQKDNAGNFIAFLCCGVFVYNFTSIVISSGTQAITSNLGLIRALHFPRASLPISVVIIELRNLLVSMVVLSVIVLATGEPLTWSWLQIFPAFFVQAMFNAGMAMFLAPIEFVSFMVRPVTLAMRLFGNMIGGHVVMYMFASFVVGLGLFALHVGGLANLGFLGSALSLFMVVALFALELIVAFLQAFVFAALTCTYLSDVVNLDHGH